MPERVGDASARADAIGLTVALLHGSDRACPDTREDRPIEEELEGLLVAHRVGRPVRIVDADPRALRDDGRWSSLADGSAAILVVSCDDDAEASEWRPAGGPFAWSSEGRPVPIGFLARSMVAGASSAAAAVRGRRGLPVGPLALLGPNRPRTADAFDWVEAALERGVPPPVCRWTSDRIGWDDLRLGLRSGLGCALYMGHATPEAWHAYGGVTAERLVDAIVGPVPARRPTDRSARAEDLAGRPIGAVLALTCNSAGPRRPDTGDSVSPSRGPQSFAANVVAHGAAVSVLAAVGVVAHSLNRRLAGATVTALASGAETLADFVSQAAADVSLRGRLGDFWIIGDPLAPLAGDPASWDRVARVAATDPAVRLTATTATWPSQLASTSG